MSLTSMIVPEGKSIFQIKKAGIVTLDFLPYVVKGKLNPYAKEGSLHFERTYYVHRGVGAENSSYVCLRRTFKKKCPICDHIAVLSRDPDADSQLIKGLAPKERQLFNVIDLKDKDKGVQLFEYSHWNFGKVLDAKIRRYDDGRYDFFADLEQGLSVEIEFDEEKMGGYTFYKAAGITFIPRRKAYSEDILEEVICLDDVPREFGYKELNEIFLQKGEDEDTDEEEEDEDTDEEEEDEEDLPPKKKPTKKVDEEEDEEDEDEDEDEEVTAKQKGIKVDTWVKHKKFGKCKVVHVSGDGTSLRLVDEFGEMRKAVAPADCEVLVGKKPIKKNEEEEDEEDEDVKPKRKRGKKEEEEEDEEEDDEEDEEEDDEEDEEEEEKPKKGKKPKPKVKSKKDDDDDDDGWED